MKREILIAAALGEREPDLVLKNARVVNVFSGEVVPGDIAIADGMIAGVGSYDSGKRVVDLGGKFVAPGFIDAHVHVESSMVSPPAYCTEALGWGTTTLVTDPHEIANVAGGAGEDDPITHSVHLAPLADGCLALPKRESYPVINVMPGNVTTTRTDLPASEVDSLIAAGKLRRIAVFERHHATGNVGVGLIAGYGLTHGAVATTVAHDSHNLIVVGDNESDMLAAVREIERVQGGYTIAADGKILGTLPLPVAGLMSNETADTLIPALDGMIALAKKQGVAEGIDPFITLSFMALPVIGDIRITDMGMFDVTKFSFIE